MTAASVVVDANLLVLFVVGVTDPGMIHGHKRLAAYSGEDFELLVSFLGRYGTVLVTPGVLTEAHNLAMLTEKGQRTRLQATFRDVLRQTGEHHVPSLQVVESDAFDSLGLTDAGLLLVAAGGSDLLTADAKLYVRASAQGLKAHNFHHLRTWLS